jgi:hypothetical protein
MKLDDFGDGIYIIQTIKNGKEIKKSAEKLAELPDVMIKASFEPYRYKISKEISMRLKKSKNSLLLGIPDYITTREIMNIIFKVFKE